MDEFLIQRLDKSRIDNIVVKSGAGKFALRQSKPLPDAALTQSGDDSLVDLLNWAVRLLPRAKAARNMGYRTKAHFHRDLGAQR